MKRFTSKESHYGVGANTFCDEIAKGTANRYTCQQFPNSALGSEREMIEARRCRWAACCCCCTGC